MSRVVEDTVKALTEFEAAIDRVKAESSDAKRLMIKNAGEWAASARSNAVAEAQKIAAQRLAAARKAAESEAQLIRKAGEAEMRKFEESISRRKKEAGELVVRRLLGEK